MNKVTLFRLLEATIIAFVLFSITFCASILPDVFTGPFGYNKAMPSAIMSFLAVLLPTNWLCFAIVPFAFYGVYSQNGTRPITLLRVVTIICFVHLGISGIFIRDLLSLHAVLAVEPQSTSVPRFLFNFLLCIVMASAVLIRVQKSPTGAQTAQNQPL